MSKTQPQVPKTGRGNLHWEIEHDEAVAKRGTPSMPKLAFMNGTKWGKDPRPNAWPRQA